MTEQEEWRVCADYPDYSVSSFGRVMRTSPGNQPWSVPGRVLKHDVNKDGHARVTLFTYGIRKKEFVHRLVCSAWHGPCHPDRPIACHRNDDKSDNTPKNIYWGTIKDNGRDSVRNGKSVRGESVNTARLTEAQVVEIRHKAASGALNTELAKEYGVPDSNISMIVRGINWKQSGGPIRKTSRRGQPQANNKINIIWRDGADESSATAEDGQANSTAEPRGATPVRHNFQGVE